MRRRCALKIERNLRVPRCVRVGAEAPVAHCNKVVATEGACLFASVVKALQLAHPCERHTALSLRMNASETVRSNRAFELFPALHARRGVP